MADIETLRREFEAVCQQEPLRLCQLDLAFDNKYRLYIIPKTQAAFDGFSAGRKASQAEIEELRELAESRLRQRWDNNDEYRGEIDRLKAEIREVVATVPKSCRVIVCEGGGAENPEASLAVSMSKMNDEIERLRSDLKLHSKRADDSNQTCIELMAEIERLQSIVARAPKFADGKPAFDGDPAWHPSIDCEGWVDVNMGRTPVVHRATFVIGDLELIHKPLSECYPTREAMEKANV